MGQQPAYAAATDPAQQNSPVHAAERKELEQFLERLHKGKKS